MAQLESAIRVAANRRENVLKGGGTEEYAARCAGDYLRDWLCRWQKWMDEASIQKVEALIASYAGGAQ